MKPIIQISIKGSLVVLLACRLLFAGLLNAGPEGEFKLMKDRNGINLYYRRVNLPNGVKVRQMKAVLEFKGESEKVLELLKDGSRASRWLKSSEQYLNLTDVEGPRWFCYIRFDIPWPLSNQDCILEFSTCTDPEGETIISFQCKPDYMEPFEGIKRMEDINGCMLIRPLTKEESVLECNFLSAKAPVIPRWITDPIVTSSILNMMEALRKELNEMNTSNKMSYENASL